MDGAWFEFQSPAMYIVCLIQRICSIGFDESNQFSDALFLLLFSLLIWTIFLTLQICEVVMRNQVFAAEY